MSNFNRLLKKLQTQLNEGVIIPSLMVESKELYDEILFHFGIDPELPDLSEISWEELKSYLTMLKGKTSDLDTKSILDRALSASTVHGAMQILTSSGN